MRIWSNLEEKDLRWDRAPHNVLGTVHHESVNRLQKAQCWRTVWRARRARTSNLELLWAEGDSYRGKSSTLLGSAGILAISGIQKVSGTAATGLLTRLCCRTRQAFVESRTHGEEGSAQLSARQRGLPMVRRAYCDLFTASRSLPLGHSQLDDRHIRPQTKLLGEGAPQVEFSFLWIS